MQRFGVGGFVFVLDTREATNRSNLAGGSRSISIHASAWEATANVHKFRNNRRATC